MLHPIKQTQANILKFKGLTAPFPIRFILKAPMMLGEPTRSQCLMPVLSPFPKGGSAAYLSSESPEREISKIGECA